MATHDAVAAAQRVEHDIVSGKRAGVAHYGFLGTFAPPALDHQDRLPDGKRARRGSHECRRAANAFDEADDDLRVLVVEEELEIIGQVEIKLVAARNAVRKPETA